MSGEFVMPGGMYSGRRYAIMTPKRYEQLNSDPKHRKNKTLDNSINLAYLNTEYRMSFDTTESMIKKIQALYDLIHKYKRGDTITLITYKPIEWHWCKILVEERILMHTVFITDRGHYNFDEIIGLPVTEVMLIVENVTDFVTVNRLPNKSSVRSSILVDSNKVHWALGGLRTSGRPDICLYINLQTLSPNPKGASV